MTAAVWEIPVDFDFLINNFFSLLLDSPRVSLIQPAYGSVNRFLYHAEEGWTPMELNARAPLVDKSWLQ